MEENIAAKVGGTWSGTLEGGAGMCGKVSSPGEGWKSEQELRNIAGIKKDLWMQELRNIAAISD